MINRQRTIQKPPSKPGSTGLFFYLATVELFAAAPADQITRVWVAATPRFEDGPAFRASAFRSRRGGLFFIVHRLIPFLLSVPAYQYKTARVIGKAGLSHGLNPSRIGSL